MKLQICLAFALITGFVMSCTGQQPDRSAAPVLLTPESNAELDNGCTDGSDSVEWEFKWSEVPGARRYHLFITGARGQYPVVDITNLKRNSYRRQQKSYITDFNRRGWRWKVRALVGTVWSDWSEERTFDAEPIDTDCP